VKQKVYNQSVEGNGEEPADVVDTVAYAIQDVLENYGSLDEVTKQELYSEVISFCPDYIEGLEGA
jgi:hypothetical protein